MAAIDLEIWAQRCEAFLVAQRFTDASHGLDHVRRVVHSARQIGASEGARPEVVVPAAWLHDCVAVEKDDPRRAQASTLAAEKAVAFLTAEGYPARWLGGIAHAIAAHSFSAGIPPETVEARVVQDADRLDALGAIGLARCFMVGERLGLPLYHPGDPFAAARTPDDRQYVLDHFYVKLLTLPATMQTEAGRQEAQRRVQFLEAFLAQLAHEISTSVP